MLFVEYPEEAFWKKSGYIFFLFLYQRNSLSYLHYTRSSYTCQSGIKTSRFSAGPKKSGIKRGVPRWKSTGAIIMKNCREACSRGCHLSCTIIIAPKYEQTMNKPNFFVLFSQLSTSALLFIVDIHNILSDMLILRPSDITYFQDLTAIL